jgi:TPR repeat protein
MVGAQYNLGILYGHGWGVAQSYPRAYFWLAIAAASGQKLEGIDIVQARDEAASHLSSSVLAQTRQETQRWMPQQH